MNLTIKNRLRILLISGLSALAFVFVFQVTSVSGQPAVVARNLSLGGGGTAYLTGFEATFYNPANLMMYEREGTFHFGMSSGAFYFDPVLFDKSKLLQFDRFNDIFEPYRRYEQRITDSQRSSIIEENYPGKKLVSRHQNRAEIILGGIQWQLEDKAYSLVARARMASTTETGRGWYSNDFIENDGKAIRDFTLVKNEQVLYELSFGFAQEFEFLNGLTPSINKLFLGIAPKLTVGGAYTHSIYRSRYESREGFIQAEFIQQFEHRSSGQYSKMNRDFIRSNNLPQSIRRNLDNRFYMNPTGIGAGLDFGLTYIIPLGSNFSLSENGGDRQPVKRSLRLALSITDLGFIHYSSEPQQLEAVADTIQLKSQEPAQSMFIGAAGQYLAFFEEAGTLPNPFLNGDHSSDENFSMLLPTSLNTGVLLDIEKLRLMGDVTLGLNDTAFNTTKLSAHLGAELRPLPYLPLRLGSRFTSDLPVLFGFGTGIETRHWDFSVASQFMMKSGASTSEMIGGAVAGLQFHL